MESLSAMVAAHKVQTHIETGSNFSLSETVKLGGVSVQISASGEVSDTPIDEHTLASLAHALHSFWGILSALTEILTHKQIELNYAFHLDGGGFFNVSVVLREKSSE